MHSVFSIIAKATYYFVYLMIYTKSTVCLTVVIIYLYLDIYFYLLFNISNYYYNIYCKLMI